MKKRLLVCVLIFSGVAKAQTDSENSLRPAFFVSGNYEYGYVLQTDDFLKGNNLEGGAITTVSGGRFEVGWQARGRNVYDAMLKYPSYGAGFLTYGFPQTNELGYPNALYLFFNKPYKRWGSKYEFNYFIRLGMSYNWEPNNPAVNPANLVLGSFRNLYISAGLEMAYHITPRLKASAGGAFSHFSNGQSSLPNSGMNLLTPHIAITYSFRKEKPFTYPELDEPEYTNKGIEYYFTIGNGIRQIFFSTSQTGVPSNLGVSYPVYNISAAAQYHFNWRGKFGGGLDFIYWGAQNPGLELAPGGLIKPTKVPFNEKLQLGVFASYEFVMNNVSIYLQPGYRIIKTDYPGMPPAFYQHMGLKYHVHHLILGIAIRAVSFSVAEYIEWNVGYRFGKHLKH